MPAVVIYAASTVLLFVAIARLRMPGVMRLFPFSGFLLLVGAGLIWINLTTSWLMDASGALLHSQFLYAMAVTVTSVTFLATTSSRITSGCRAHQWFDLHPLSGLVIVVAIPCIAVAVKFLQLGLSTGDIYASPGWRAAVASGARGYEFLLYQSGAPALSAAIFLLGVRYRRVGVVITAGMLCGALTVYGGRFVVFAGVAIGLYLLALTKNIHYDSRKSMLFGVAIALSLVMFAALRYSATEDVIINTELLSITLLRQLAGNVYDFALSSEYVDPEEASSLIGRKLIVAFAPFLQGSSSVSETLGSYLAYSAGRSFEGGHRVGYVGELYYLGGYGLCFAALILMGFACSALDRLYRRGRMSLITAAALMFSVAFSVLIDVSYLLTGLYLFGYLFLVRQLMFAVTRRRVQ